MPFLNLEWTSNRIQFFGEVDLFSVLSGLLYRNEWSSISGILSIPSSLTFLIISTVLSVTYPLLDRSVPSMSHMIALIVIIQSSLISSIENNNAAFNQQGVFGNYFSITVFNEVLI